MKYTAHIGNVNSKLRISELSWTKTLVDVIFNEICIFILIKITSEIIIHGQT